MSFSRRILLLGSNGRAALAVCRALGQAGHRVSILRLAAQRTPADHSKFCEQPLYIGTPDSPDSNISGYLNKLTDLLRPRAYDYLIPADDLACALTYSHYREISSLIRVIGPAPASFAKTHNNFDALQVALQLGLTVPQTHLLRQGQPLPALTLPCLVRPVVSHAIIDGYWQRFRARRVNTLDELDAKLRDDLPRVDVMLQAPAAGTALSISCCMIEGNVLGASIARAIHELPRGGTSYQKIERPNSQLLDMIEAAGRYLAWTGFMTIDCKEERGKLSFIKLVCNPTAALSASLPAGVDFPNLVLNALEGRRRAGISLPVKTLYVRDLRRDVFWLLSEIASGNGPRVVAPWITSFGPLFMGTEYLAIEQVKDPLPVLRQFDSGIRALCRKIERRLRAALRFGRNASADMLTKSSSLLIVCQGNINRSVVAEHIFRSLGFQNVSSAGLLPVSGRRPSIHAERFLLEHLGIDISTFRSKCINRIKKETGEAGLILCFERSQAAELARRFPDMSKRIFLLSELAARGGGPRDIADPHGKSPETYRACFRRIDELIRRAAVR